MNEYVLKFRNALYEFVEGNVSDDYLDGWYSDFYDENTNFQTLIELRNVSGDIVSDMVFKIMGKINIVSKNMNNQELLKLHSIQEELYIDFDRYRTENIVDRLCVSIDVIKKLTRVNLWLDSI